MSKKANETAEVLEGFRTITFSKKVVVKAPLNLYAIASHDYGVEDTAYEEREEAEDKCGADDVVLHYVLAPKQPG